jgi:hypothetical protein
MLIVDDDTDVTMTFKAVIGDLTLDGMNTVQSEVVMVNPNISCIGLNLTNNPQLTPMRKRFVFATVIVFGIAIMIIIPFNGFIFPFTAVAQQQQINSSTNSSSPPNPLPLKNSIQTSRESRCTNNKQDTNSNT